MLVSDYNYDLPEERIAKYPPEVRGSTRLLVLDRKTGEMKDDYYKNLDDYLEPGDVIVLNDTRVMRSRLFAKLPDGRSRELIVLEKHGAEGVKTENTAKTEKVMYRGKLHENDILTVENEKIIVKTILGGGIAEVESDTPLEKIAEKYGNVPLPPYLHRDADQNDRARYQTVWAKNMGSAAAPTASLNMTEELLEKLRKKGVKIKYLTLHVGLGTFLPMRTERIEDHHMHSEWFQIPEETLEAIKTAKENKKKIVAVGTTVTRTLEFYARTGKQEGEDDIFIYPGYEFQLVDVLLTNFHAPKSTVLMLASAFAGWGNLKSAYDHAIAEKYNFLSYGDSMFIC